MWQRVQALGAGHLGPKLAPDIYQMHGQVLAIYCSKLVFFIPKVRLIRVPMEKRLRGLNIVHISRVPAHRKHWRNFSCDFIDATSFKKNFFHRAPLPSAQKC